jgi:pyrroloquinoline quinone biosynthesis protein B
MKNHLVFALMMFLVQSVSAQKVELIVLGTLQDGGMPHIGCEQKVCRELIQHPDPAKKVVSLGLIDHDYQKNYLFEATPDISSQLSLLKEYSPFQKDKIPNGIFLTHAHMGHYTGLLQLGKEALDAKSETVFAMPRMKSFLESNQPWSMLIDQKNIQVESLENETPKQLTPNINVIPVLVPHRDELSETVGYKIVGPNKTVLFIPDINKWSLWNKDILTQIKAVDYAFIDATFFDNSEVGYRDLSQIPHPFVIESMDLLNNLSKSDKEKIYFIHFNHTNPLVDLQSLPSKKVKSAGFQITRMGMQLEL